MSTTTAAGLVKQRLLSRVEQCCEQLQRLAESLPETLAELAAAEELVRKGVLEVGRQLLQGWGEVADAGVDTPECGHCQEPMRKRLRQGAAGNDSGRLAGQSGTLSLRVLQGRMLSTRRAFAVPGACGELALGEGHRPAWRAVAV